MYQNRKIKNILILLVISVFQWNCVDKNQNDHKLASVLGEKTTENKEITESQIFTTAHGTDLQLSQTGTVNFSEFQQPLETEASILVNRDRLHQTFVGIGAALTDASAETFYKLKRDQQKIFFEAYFSKDKGIGYSFGR